MKKKYRIAFICHFSNPLVRKHLELKSRKFRNFIYGLRGTPLYDNDDYAIWVSDYIQEFEKHDELEFHIVAPHKNMKKEAAHFENNGIHYHFFKCDSSYIVDLCNTHLHIEENNNYKRNRARVKSFLSQIEPDLVMLCGAENPYYSASILDIDNKPVIVILQTLLNDKKRIEMGVGTPYRRKIEADIFKHAGYFCTTNETAQKRIHEFNRKAVIFPIAFPTHRPNVVIPDNKDFDLVFFARTITKNKGIEDLIKALAIAKKDVDNIKLNVIGGYDLTYKRSLDTMIVDLDIQDNVSFTGYYESINDTYSNVVKAKVAVVPGLTAALNSTVREAMFLGMPTICYETSATTLINENKECLITTPLGDVNGLAQQIVLALTRENYSKQIGLNGKEYAEQEFGNEAIVNNLLEKCKMIIRKSL